MTDDPARRASNQSIVPIHYIPTPPVFSNDEPQSIKSPFGIQAHGGLHSTSMAFPGSTALGVCSLPPDTFERQILDPEPIEILLTSSEVSSTLRVCGAKPIPIFCNRTLTPCRNSESSSD